MDVTDELMLAALHSDATRVQRLVERGARTDAVTVLGSTVLHLAAMNGQHGQAIVRYLVSRIVTSTDCNGDEPIHYALRKGNFGVARQLLKHRADGMENLLHLCVVQSRLELAQAVHRHEPRLVNGVDREGRNVVHLAALFSDLDTCRWVVGVADGLALRALATRHNASALHLAALNRTHGAQVAPLLVARLGLRVEARTASGETPLHLALLVHNLEVAARLLTLGADINVDYHGGNLLHFCAARNLLSSARFVYAREPDLIRELDVRGQTALHVAAKAGNVEFCEWLVAQGVDVHGISICGQTALDCVPRDNQALVRFFRSLRMRSNSPC